MKSAAGVSVGLIFAFCVATACEDTTAPPLIRAGATSCAAGTDLFSTPPIALGFVNGWVPLGNLNPVAHTMPTDHQSLYYGPTGGASIPIVAPTAMWVTRAKISQYSTGIGDYSLEFQPCLDVMGEFGRVSAILAKIVDQLGPFDQNCKTHSPSPGQSVTQCSTMNGAVKFEAGETIGTVGTVATNIALDFSLWDKRKTPITFANSARWEFSYTGFDRFHVVAGSDYFTEPAKSLIAAKLGSSDGATQRTVAPLGGTIATDSVGVQGSWFLPGVSSFPESQHLAIARDNVNPDTFVFSIGTSQPGFTGGSFPFTPQLTGTNLHPALVTPMDGMVCYQPNSGTTVLLLRAITTTQVRLEVRPGAGTCASQSPYVFLAGKTTDYLR
jgi:hypothetical protein